jgi:tRNA pseudouridine55 synthase
MNGVLIIDKPKGWTSHDVVNRARRVLQEKRIGHTGTLDPLATGVLVLCIGKATRLVRYLETDDKEYTAEMRLGSVTDTQDASGVVLESREYLPPSEEQVRSVLKGFLGGILQRPPAYSALKVNGIPSYKLARQGTVREHPERAITIHAIDLNEYRDPIIRFSVHCSKGTYVRTLCVDIGARLGAGGHLTALRRDRAGRFSLEQALTMEMLADRAASDQLQDALLPLSAVLQGYPAVTVSGPDAERIGHGNAISIPPAASLPPEDGPIRILDSSGEMLAVARVQGGALRPEVVVS